jgi:hypothetical protein
MTKKRLVKSKGALVSHRDRSVRSREARKELTRVNAKRSPHAQEIDDSMSAPIASSIGQWLDDPNRYDVPGVDTPTEWRNRRERKEVQETKSQEKKLKEMKKTYGTEYSPATSSLVSGSYDKYVQKKREMLEWQKKHPFISAQIYSRKGEYWDGYRQYQWALESGHDFGFDLQRPQADFIDTYNLKRYDVKGMRVLFVPEDAKVMEHSNAFYINGTQTMAVPEIKSEFVAKTREDSIKHEVGHHIYHNSFQLMTDWNDKKVRVTRLGGHPIISRTWHTMGEEEVTMADLVIYKNRYFLYFPTRDINDWVEYYKREGIYGEKLNDMLHDEAFAELFRVYRNGDIKREIRREREYLNEKREDRKYIEKKIEPLLTVKPKDRGKDLKAALKDYRKDLRTTDKAIAALGAEIDNMMLVNNWMKKHDKDMWGIGVLKFFEERPTGSSFAPKNIPENDVRMGAADAKIVEGPPDTIIAGRYGGWKDKYRLIKHSPLERRRAYDVAKNLRKQYRWRIKVRKFGDGYYLYKLVEKEAQV